MFTTRVARDWRTAGLDARDKALCAFAGKLTERPSEVTEADVASLRQVGFSDEAILDAVQVVGYFNYINRVAEALGVEEEPGIRPWESGPLDPGASSQV